MAKKFVESVLHAVDEVQKEAAAFQFGQDRIGTVSERGIPEGIDPCSDRGVQQ